MEKRAMSDKKNLITSSIIGALLSFPLTGFIYGFCVCEDCEDGISGIFRRIFIGFIEAVLTTITLGKPWSNEGGTNSTNLRLYVFLTALIITLFLFFIQKRKQNKYNFRNKY